jgi:hypothetical protein
MMTDGQGRMTHDPLAIANVANVTGGLFTGLTGHDPLYLIPRYQPMTNDN